MKLMLKVKCLKCGAIRKTESLKSAPCFVCGHDSVIFNQKTGKSRVVSIVKGDRQLLTKELYKQGIYKRKR